MNSFDLYRKMPIRPENGEAVNSLTNWPAHPCDSECTYHAPVKNKKDNLIFPTELLLIVQPVIVQAVTEQESTHDITLVETRKMRLSRKVESSETPPSFYFFFFVSLKSNVLSSPAFTMAVNVDLVLYCSGIGSLYPGPGGASRGVSIVTLFSPTWAPLALFL